VTDRQGLGGGTEVIEVTAVGRRSGAGGGAAGSRDGGSRETADAGAAGPEAIEAVLEELLTATHAAGPAELPDVARRCGHVLDLWQTEIHVVDLQQRRLLPLSGSGPGIAVDGTEAGWAYRTLSVRVEEVGRDALALWFPLVNGVERLGVLGVRSASLTPATLRRGRLLASLLAMVIGSKRAHSDLYARLTRTEPMRLPSEMLRAHLPERTIGNADVVSTAVLEPAYELGGDGFDHALTSTRLYASILDAMGHDLASGLTTAVALAGCRNARRNGADLPGTASEVDEALARWLPDRFCTGVLLQLDVSDGTLRWCNCGHPPPLLIRDERVVPGALERPAQLPLGTPAELAPEPREVHETVLEPGDRVLLYTDGVTEARVRGGGLYGVERFSEAVIRATASGELASEVLRQLIHEILDGQDNQLRDDATILLIEWCPPHGPAAELRAASRTSARRV
jgi:hypothetical protein